MFVLATFVVSSNVSYISYLVVLNPPLFKNPLFNITASSTL